MNLSGGVAVWTVGNLSLTGTSLDPTQFRAAHTVTAKYLGNNNYHASAAGTTESVAVIQDGTTVTLTSSVNPSFFNQPIALTAVVKPAAPGAGVPTGTATFFDNTTNKTLAAIKLVGGRAVLTTAALAVGTHDITVSYTPDTNNFLGSTSDHLMQSVLSQTVASLSASVSPSTGVGINSPFTITVTALDTLGQRDFNYNAAVSIILVSAPSGGTLVGTLNGTFTRGVIGFGGLQVTQAGIYKVKIVSGGLVTFLTFGTGRLV